MINVNHIWTCPISSAQLVSHFENQEIAVEEGPVERTGAGGGIVPVYIRGPDGNLIEISSYR